MGQVNLPLLNKTGTSTLWESSFENMFDFSLELNRSLFAKKVLKTFLKDSSSKIYLFLKKKKILAVLKSINANYYLYPNILKEMKLFSNRLHFFKKAKLNVFYPTKIYYIKYNKWSILTLRIYKPKVRSIKIAVGRLNIDIYSNSWKTYYLFYLKKLNFNTNKISTNFVF